MRGCADGIRRLLSSPTVRSCDFSLRMPPVTTLGLACAPWRVHEPAVQRCRCCTSAWGESSGFRPRLPTHGPMYKPQG